MKAHSLRHIQSELDLTDEEIQLIRSIIWDEWDRQRKAANNSLSEHAKATAENKREAIFILTSKIGI